MAASHVVRSMTEKPSRATPAVTIPRPRAARRSPGPALVEAAVDPAVNDVRTDSKDVSNARRSLCTQQPRYHRARLSVDLHRDAPFLVEEFSSSQGGLGAIIQAP
jgi:hypothetical protein